ncbi:hypothetical protein JXQ31_17075 [candidate division KSB1 bacterium]|nr:hypothetical protein [candidate division KSB1 bacterium]
MKFKLSKVIFPFLYLLLIFFSCKNDVTEPPKEQPIPETGEPKFEPPDGEKLFILGQANNTYMEAYINKVKNSPVPAGFAYYTSLSDGAVQGDMPKYKTFLDKYPNTVLQLAIWTGERQWGDPGYYLNNILMGKYDRNINALANACKTFGKPVFIRFGYEFDGWHNAYPPDKYIVAYKYFVDKMRAQNVNNVAYVWHSWGVAAYYGREDFPQYYPKLPDGTEVTQQLWYPGDDYVDWVAMSIFGIGWGNLKTNEVVQFLIAFAETHNKPVMLAETAAIKTSGSSDSNWVIPNTNWFEQVFDLCNTNNAVKAFTYINVDWEADNPSSTWGDTQIQNAPYSVINYWLRQIKPFLHADADLYTKIGFTP